MSISEIRHWCWAIRPVLQLAFQFISKVYDGSVVTSISTNHFCMDLALCKGALSCWNRKGHSQTVASMLEAQNRLECHCMMLRSNFPSLEQRDLAQIISQTQICLSDCQMVKRNSSLQRNHFHRSSVQWRWALHHSSRCLALHMVILGLCAVSLHGNPFQEAPDEQFLCWVLQPRTDIFLRALCFSPRQSRSVSLCGLTLRSWAVVTPRSFHFTITALTADRGRSSRAEIWWTDLLKRWHPLWC